MIRRARLEDLDALVSLEAMFPTDRMSRRSLRRALQSRSVRIWVAIHDGFVCGSLVLFTRQGSRRVRIYSVGVHPRARGQGYARRLIAAAEAAARKAHAASIALEVRNDNTPALLLYTRLGYTVERELPNYYTDGADGQRLFKTL